MKNNFIELEHGAGGKKSEELIGKIRRILSYKGAWKNTGDDGAVLDLNRRGSINRTPTKYDRLVFTTDAFIIDPLFFPGGDIGKIAISGTINDLAVMGAKPLGVSLSLVIEEGFPEDDLMKIVASINKVSRETGTPVVTGDTKVTEKGKIDKIEIATSGVGLAENIIPNGGAKVGDVVISSGDLGEHTAAILASRFNYKTHIKSDSKPLVKEIQSVVKYLHSCKDPTRGGMAAVLNEIAEKSRVKIVLDEKTLPFKKEVVAISELLGIDKFSFASEGRFVATVAAKDADKTIKILQKYNREAKIIGAVERGHGVWLKTSIGSIKRIETPRGKLVPRIC
ncbi:MAG: Hydrogenase expression/formation protein HypE [Patescibacteria group bacterium]|nr:Hydrogenase expression/formation protein HypE [Patescibacteria group bacterium]